ncbi:hypothetical protein Rsub_03853 [Raphidocelis subcapitata]|uniref:Uncharacterized protein n=1 Tax=Raphidocelis subcapitata TaxID=307507 RepID=A0A2V0NTJ7_9CHLO|nr:hypothetical protein Rsub_03853 [Raphidocelis subcapitata]|eukprot:GBF90998.1 hypothetical protein Rsub_03853 [Raphidocelis subcapitata]
MKRYSYRLHALRAPGRAAVAVLLCVLLSLLHAPAAAAAAGDPRTQRAPRRAANWTAPVQHRRLQSAGVQGNWVEPKCSPDGPFCGGGPPDWLAESQCSGYPLKPSNVREMNSAWCVPNQEVISNFAGAPNGAGVWRYRDPVTGAWAGDYFVIHGCDGAGLMGDCKLGAQYFEHIYPADWVVGWSLNDAARYSDPTAFNDVWDTAGFSCTLDASGRWSDAARCNAPHVRRPFPHPGTGYLQQLDAGMWDWSGIKDVCNDKAAGVGDCGKPWGASMPFGPEKTADWYRAVARDLNGGTDPVAVGFAVVYPWVCNKWGDGQGNPKRWGTGGNWQGWPPADGGTLMDVFWGGGSWGGGAQPYSPNQRYIECYFDNEPYDVLSPNAHSTSPYTPPAWEAFMFFKPQAQGSLKMLRIGHKAFSDGQGQAYSRDALMNPGPNLFELQWAGYSTY